MATVTDLQAVRESKDAEAFSKKLVGDVLLDEFELNTAGLAMALAHVDKAVFFSGDVEEGEARKARVCEGAQLLHAAKHQLYSYSLHGSRLRLAFDGDYLYDLYFKDSLTVDFLEKIIDVIKSEHSLNFTKKLIQSLKFQISLTQNSGKD